MAGRGSQAEIKQKGVIGAAEVHLSAIGGSDYGNVARHGFSYGQAEAFSTRGINGAAGTFIQLCQGLRIKVAINMNTLRAARLLGAPAGQLFGDGIVNIREGLQHQGNVVSLAELGKERLQ